MSETVIIFIFAIPAILGLAEILHIVKLFLLGGKTKIKSVLVVVPNNENYFKQLMNISEQKRWQGDKYAEKIIVLNTLLEKEKFFECRILAEKLGFEFCDKYELNDKIT